MTEVTRLTESKEGGWQVLTFTVRFRNLSDQELVLAHTDRSAVAVDDLGNRYGSINNDYVKGMGISRYGSPRSVLQTAAQ